MKSPVQDRVINFISTHPGTRIGEIIEALSEIDRSSISSALTRMTKQGRLIRMTGRNQQFTYRVARNEPIPQIPEKTEIPQPPAAPFVSKQQVISQDEWNRRLEQIKELIAKGLHRRASRLSLELLDVTGDARLRDQLIMFKAGTCRLGVWL